MWLTEEQAKKTWCPHAMVVQGDVLTVSFNRVVVIEKSDNTIKEVVNSPRGTKCIAHECASWRWEDSNEIQEIYLTKEAGVKERRGYCGLAGRPCS